MVRIALTKWEDEVYNNLPEETKKILGQLFFYIAHNEKLRIDDILLSSATPHEPTCASLDTSNEFIPQCNCLISKVRDLIWGHHEEGYHMDNVNYVYPDLSYPPRL